MEILIILAIGYLILAPLALILSIVALNKIRALQEQLGVVKPTQEEVMPVPSQSLEQAMPVSPQPQEQVVPSPSQPKEPVREAGPAVEEILSVRATSGKIPAAALTAAEKPKEKEKGIGLEQRIGTKWVPVVGIITTLVGTGFFLKYAYDNNLIGPMGRVMISAVAGLIALVVGEWTRRRDYGLVAKGLTALGFGILYATIYGAYNFYHLIEAGAAFGISILITLAAMLYAVGLNEVLVAVLALLGGYLSPVLLSTGENRPMGLFTYVSLLSVGAMLCAFFRKWRAVTLLAFVGTFALYTGWFEKFYNPTINPLSGRPDQLMTAVLWLSIFFVIFLVMPVLFELIRQVKVHKEDVCLILSNAAVVFYYLWVILFTHYRVALAIAALVIAAAHLVLMGAVNQRCREDVPLRLALLVISMFFVTAAIPLYLKMYAVAMAWAAEGVILTLIGLRYQSIWTRVGGFAALALSGWWLCGQLPLHTAAFQFLGNKAFGSWCFVAAGVGLCHLLYRRTTMMEPMQRREMAEILYAALLYLLLAAVSMEWYYHTRYNLLATETGQYHEYYTKGMVLFLAATMLLFIVKPLSPSGAICQILAAITGAAGSIFMLIVFTGFYYDRFKIFVNSSFVIGLIFVLGLFLAAILLRQREDGLLKNRLWAFGFSLAGIFVLWVLLTEEIYLYWHYLGKAALNPERYRFLGQMYISVMWAVYAAILMTTGFWRKSASLRYIALGLFTVLLGKVFVFDMGNLKSVYRIAGFVVLGITLVGISYLYQYGKKRGFFSTLTQGQSEGDE